VSSLWVGPDLPDLQAMCIRTFLPHHEYHLWTYQEYSNIPNGVIAHDAQELIPLEVYQKYEESGLKHYRQTFSNHFRYKLIHEVGDWWVDTDLICIKTLPDDEYVFTFVEDIPLRLELQGLGLPEMGGNLANGFFKAPAKCEFMAKLVEVIERELSSGVPECFGEWGTILFTKTAVDLGLYGFRLPKSLIGNNYNTWPQIYQDKEFQIPESAYALHLYNYVKGDTDFVEGTVLAKYMENYS